MFSPHPFIYNGVYFAGIFKSFQLHVMYGSSSLWQMKRPVRTCMQGVVEAEG